MISKSVFCLGALVSFHFIKHTAARFGEGVIEAGKRIISALIPSRLLPELGRVVLPQT